MEQMRPSAKRTQSVKKPIDVFLNPFSADPFFTLCAPSANQFCRKLAIMLQRTAYTFHKVTLAAAHQQLLCHFLEASGATFGEDSQATISGSF